MSYSIKEIINNPKIKLSTNVFTVLYSYNLLDDYLDCIKSTVLKYKDDILDVNNTNYNTILKLVSIDYRSENNKKIIKVDKPKFKYTNKYFDCDYEVDFDLNFVDEIVEYVSGINYKVDKIGEVDSVVYESNKMELNNFIFVNDKNGLTIQSKDNRIKVEYIKDDMKIKNDYIYETSLSKQDIIDLCKGNIFNDLDFIKFIPDLNHENIDSKKVNDKWRLPFIDLVNLIEVKH